MVRVEAVLVLLEQLYDLWLATGVPFCVRLDAALLVEVEEGVWEGGHGRVGGSCWPWCRSLWTSDVRAEDCGGEEAQESCDEELNTHSCDENKQCLFRCRLCEMEVDAGEEDRTIRCFGSGTFVFGYPLPLNEHPRLIPFIPLFQAILKIASEEIQTRGDVSIGGSQDLIGCVPYHQHSRKLREPRLAWKVLRVLSVTLNSIWLI